MISIVINLGNKEEMTVFCYGAVICGYLFIIHCLRLIKYRGYRIGVVERVTLVIDSFFLHYSCYHIVFHSIKHSTHADDIMT